MLVEAESPSRPFIRRGRKPALSYFPHQAALPARNVERLPHSGQSVRQALTAYNFDTIGTAISFCGPIRVLRPASPRSISRLRHQEKMSSNRTRTGSDTPEYSAISEATKTHNNTPKIALVYQGSYRSVGELMLVLPPLSTRLARKMFGGCDFL